MRDAQKDSHDWFGDVAENLIARCAEQSRAQDAGLLELFHATIALDASDRPRFCVIGYHGRSRRTRIVRAASSDGNRDCA